MPSMHTLAAYSAAYGPGDRDAPHGVTRLSWLSGGDGTLAPVLCASLAAQNHPVWQQRRGPAFRTKGYRRLDSRRSS